MLARTRAIAFLCLANARSSITAPMKLEKSVTSPIARPSVSATSWSLILSHTERATYARDAAEHFWPWYSNAPRSIATRATSGSAEGCTTTKSLPPVSPTMRG